MIRLYSRYLYKLKIDLYVWIKNVITFSNNALKCTTKDVYILM